MPSPIGHAMAGVAVAWAGDLLSPGRMAPPGPRTRLTRAGGTLTLVCAVLAVAPDLDMLSASHRTVTHSVGAVIVVGLCAAVVARALVRPVASLALTCAGAYGTHILLDWLCADAYPPYGLQALWPFSHTWYISNLDLFKQAASRHLLRPEIIHRNVAAIAREVTVLGPILLGLWLIREEAAARLAPKVSRGDQTTE